MPRVPVEDLVDLEALASGDRPASPKTIRQALPPGWVLDEDGCTARKDLRVMARTGPVLVLGLVLFGGAIIFLFMETFPKGWKGVTRAGILIAIMLAVGGIVGPLVTRALNRGVRH